MARYEIKLPSNEAIDVVADKVRQGASGELLIFGASGNPNPGTGPDVIPKGDWRGYGIPFVATRHVGGTVSGKAFSVRADTRNKRKDAPMKKRGKRKNALVSDLTAFIRSYVVMSEAQTLTVALWVIHTHCFSAFQQTPYLAVTSPEKQCGKSRLLEVVSLLVHEPWATAIPSEAVLYRKIDMSSPTLLLDEVDTIANLRNDRYEGHRAILNAGHRNGILVPRCVGQSGQVEEFRSYCPKLLAGIGTLWDTVADRSIPIRMARKRPEDTVQGFRRRDAEPVATALLERVVAWADRSRDKLADARPDMPDQLSDRMQEGCEPLVAIADMLGYGPQARAALVELLTAERLDSAETMRIRLLRDIRDIFVTAERKHGRTLPGMGSEQLRARLIAVEDSPWSSYYGRSFDARDLSGLLAHYGIKRQTIRRPKSELRKGQKAIVKGYKRDDLADAWERYL